MKKLFIFTFLLICTFAAHAQRVAHHHYTTYYDAALKEPDSVAWDLSPDMVQCAGAAPRHDHFMADPMIPGCATKADYTRSGFSKGHLFNWDDARCDASAVNECFYMSNMLPQNQAFNAGDWETVERYERTLAQSHAIHIIAGGTGSIGATPGGVNEPQYMWKAIYSNGRWLCWIMPNEASSTGHGYDYWEVPVSKMNATTGLKLREVVAVASVMAATAPSAGVPGWVWLVGALVLLLVVFLIWQGLKD